LLFTPPSWQAQDLAVLKEHENRPPDALLLANKQRWRQYSWRVCDHGRTRQNLSHHLRAPSPECSAAAAAASACGSVLLHLDILAAEHYLMPQMLLQACNDHLAERAERTELTDWCRMDWY